MQTVNVLDCGKRTVTINTDDGSSSTHDEYFINVSEKTAVIWNGTNVQSDPFTFGSPWDYIFTHYIDTLGSNLIGKQFIFDVDDPDGNIVKVRDGSV
jgi:hypothetical protein